MPTHSTQARGDTAIKSFTSEDALLRATTRLQVYLPTHFFEDWCLHGMEWVGRKVYEPLVHECGFQKSSEECNAELEVLETAEGGQLTA